MLYFVFRGSLVVGFGRAGGGGGGVCDGEWLWEGEFGFGGEERLEFRVVAP